MVVWCGGLDVEREGFSLVSGMLCLSGCKICNTLGTWPKCSLPVSAVGLAGCGIPISLS